jgi:hypothetical protein
MSHTLGASRIGRIILLSFFVISVTSVAAAQILKKSPRLANPSSNIPVQPQLLNADTNPTLRFPIAMQSGIVLSNLSYGWLDITRGGIHYTVDRPANKLSDGFDAPTAEIRDLKLYDYYNMLTFRGGNKKHSIFYVSQERWGSVHNAPTFWQTSAEGASGTQSIYKTMLGFDAMLALVKSTAAPPAPVIAAPVAPALPPPIPVVPPAPPAVVVASPSGASTNQTIELSESPLVIRGVAMDNTGIPVVSINGTPANMRPQNTQAEEFWSDPLPLQPGANPIQITASNSAHVEAKVAFTVNYTPKAAPVNPRALDKATVISLLQGGVPASRVVEIVKERSVKFTPTTGDLNDIRTAGGGDELIQAIQEAAPPK